MQIETQACQRVGRPLCKSKKRVIAEYALRDTNKLIGVAGYQVVEALPKELETSLPSVEQSERERRALA
jgi:YhcG PDDEXK nuclease domain